MCCQVSSTVRRVSTTYLKAGEPGAQLPAALARGPPVVRGGRQLQRMFGRRRHPRPGAELLVRPPPSRPALSSYDRRPAGVAPRRLAARSLGRAATREGPPSVGTASKGTAACPGPPPGEPGWERRRPNDPAQQRPPPH